MFIDVTENHPHSSGIGRKTFKLSILPCVDFDDTHYYTVFDPREQDQYCDGAKQIRCATLEAAMALFREIALEAVADYGTWLAKAEL